MATTLRNRIVLLLATLLGASLMLFPQAPENAGKAKGARKGPPGANHPDRIQVLIITGQNPHDWKGTTPLLRKALEDTEKFEVRVVEEFRGGTPEMLAPYALIIMNYYNGGAAQNRFGEKGDNAIADFVRSGKGIVLYHLSLGSFDGWTDYEKMSGGNWRPNQGHHSAAHDYELNIVDPNHAITAGLKTPLMIKKDELFANLRWQPEGSYHVLANAYDDHSLYGAQDKQTKVGAGTVEPILWTTEFGKGRVFVTALGHDPINTETPEFRTILQRGAEWAATGKVTIPVPPELAK
ncbi:MAG TPA: ThuA domain-containing protein [Bryobacteraceae bacterium]|jgi:hypothetical protein